MTPYSTKLLKPASQSRASQPQQIPSRQPLPCFANKYSRAGSPCRTSLPNTPHHLTTADKPTHHVHLTASGIIRKLPQVLPSTIANPRVGTSSGVSPTGTPSNTRYHTQTTATATADDTRVVVLLPHRQACAVGWPAYLESILDLKRLLTSILGRHLLS